VDECEPLKPGQTVKVRVLSLTRALLPRPTSAGDYTRPLLSSTLAVSDTKIHPEHPLILLNTP